MDQQRRSFSAALRDALPDDFLTAVFSQRQLHLAVEPALAAGLLTWEALSDLLTNGAPRPPDMMMYSDGVQLDPSAFLDARASSPVIDVPRLYGLLRGGASLVIDSIDRLHRPVREAVDDLMKHTGETASCNMFLTFGGGQAFKSHWDGIDTFVVQVAGTKRWRVHGPSIPSPSDSYGEFEWNTCPRGVLWEGVLAPGEILHVPRGWWHTVSGDGDVSLHLTFCVRRQTGLDWLQWVVSKMQAIDHVRADLSRYDAAGIQEAQVKQLIAAFADTAGEFSMADFLADMRVNFGRRQVASLPWGGGGRPPGEGDVIELVTVADPVTASTPGTFTLVSGGELFSLGPEYEAACQELLARGHMTIAEFAEAGSLAPGVARQLAGALVSQGLAVIVPCAKSTENGSDTASP